MTFTVTTLTIFSIMIICTQAIQNLKATAAGVIQPQTVNAEKPAELHKPQSSSTLPADFFDNRETKRQKGGQYHLSLWRF